VDGPGPSVKSNWLSEEVRCEGACKHLFLARPAVGIECSTEKQVEEVSSEAPVEKRVEDEVGEVTQAVWARGLAVDVRWLGEVGRETVCVGEESLQFMQLSELGAIAGAILECISEKYLDVGAVV